MPEFQTSAGAGILIDDRDETRLNNKCNLAHGAGTADVTCFQPVAFAKEQAYLLQEGTANWSGFSALDHATLTQQMATVIGANTDPHHVLIGPCGLLVGGEANFFETVQSAYDVGLTLSGVATAGSQFKLSNTGIWDGQILHASQGPHPIVLNAVQVVTFTAVPGDQLLSIASPDGNSAQFTLDGLSANINAGITALINGLSDFAATPVTVTGTLTPSSDAWSGQLTLTYSGGETVPTPSFLGGTIQSVTITNGGSGNYSIDGSGPFTLGATAASVQALIRVLGGNYAAAVVNGSTLAPVAAVQTVTFTNVPSPVWAAVQGTGNAAMSDVADPTVNADWVSAIQANAAYAGQTVSASGGISLSGGLLNGTITFTFSGGVVPALEVVTGVIDNVTASSAISIDGVTVTPGDSLVTIQGNLRAVGGADEGVYVTGTSANEVSTISLSGATGGMSGYNGVYSQSGSTFFNANGDQIVYAYAQWCLIPVFGSESNPNSYFLTSVNNGGGSSDPSTISDWTWTHGVAFPGGTAPSSTIYTAGAGAVLNLTLIYPTAASSVSPTVTVGTLTQTAALGTALGGAASSQTTAGAFGSGNYRIDFAPGVTPATASATGTGAVGATPTAAGTVAAAVTVQEGGESTAEVFNLVTESGTDAWVDSGALPVGVSPNAGILARAHVLSVAGTSPSLVIEVQHADDNGSGAPNLSTLATVETFAEISAPGVLTIRDAAATLKRWRRCNYTVGGTNPEFVFCVALATF